MAGLQGVGKTTACGKLALALQRRNKRVLMVATDVYRCAGADPQGALFIHLVPPDRTPSLLSGRRRPQQPS